MGTFSIGWLVDQISQFDRLYTNILKVSLSFKLSLSLIISIK